MIEMYKQVSRFEAIIHNEVSGQQFDFSAVVWQVVATGRFHISFSHAYQAQGALGPHYSGSLTNADSIEEAELNVHAWAETLERADQIVPWTADL